MNHLTRVMSEKMDVKFKDKYTGQVLTVSEINDMWIKPTMYMLGAEGLKEFETWFERYEKV